MTFRYRGDEAYRIFNPLMGEMGDAQNGFFLMPAQWGMNLVMQASNGNGWEHVSVSTRSDRGKAGRLPNWHEMCFAKGLFWDEEACVVQYHPPKSEHRSIWECLHLWKPTTFEFTTPDPEMVAPKPA